METPPQTAATPTVWWVLGMDTQSVWHERLIRAASLDDVQAWWTERTGRLPDIAWTAQEALSRLDAGFSKLNEWPTLPGVPAAKWFLGWVGKPDAAQMALVAVPAADAPHACLLLAHEHPTAITRILGSADALNDVSCRLRCALRGEQTVMDENILPKPSRPIDAGLSTWLAQQFETEDRHV